MAINAAQPVLKPLRGNADPTVKQFAAEIGAHENTVRNWIKQKRIRAYRVGPRLIRIDRASVVDLVTSVQSA